MGIRSERKAKQVEERAAKIKKEQDNKKITVLFKDVYACCKSCEHFKKVLIDDFYGTNRCFCAKQAYRPLNFQIRFSEDGQEYFPNEEVPVDIKLKCENITFILLDI